MERIIMNISTTFVVNKGEMLMQQHITDAEWQIMRILWGQKNMLATEIAVLLQDSKNWELTTIKTFLARLVRKNMVCYIKKGKVYVYNALLSERDCVISEMKQVLNRIYGGKPNLETEHFIFYGVPNISLISRLSAHLEQYYHHISLNYPLTYQEKQMVYLYSSQTRLHSALGLSIGPSWLRASLEWEMIHLAPEELFTDISIDSAAVHVWMQRVIHDINPLAPYWLTQGIAAYESDLLKKDRLNQKLNESSISISVDTILNLSHQYDLFREQNGYELSYSLIEMIVHQFGRTSLLKFLHNSNDYFQAFGISSSEFWNKWVYYCHIHYPNRKVIR